MRFPPVGVRHGYQESCPDEQKYKTLCQQDPSPIANAVQVPLKGRLGNCYKKTTGGFGQAKWRKSRHAAENFKRAREGVMAEATKKGVFSGSLIEPEVAQLLVDTLNLEVNP